MCGLGIGVAAAIIAVLPALLHPTADRDYTMLLITLAGIAAAGLVATILAASLALKADLIPALRNE